MYNTRTIRYIVLMIVIILLWGFVAIFCDFNSDGFVICPVAIVAASYIYWVPEKEKEKPPLKGTIQYDRKNYDVPAMRIVFNEEPLNIINYDEVTFKVDRNADLSDLDKSK